MQRLVKLAVFFRNREKEQLLSLPAHGAAELVVLDATFVDVLSAVVLGCPVLPSESSRGEEWAGPTYTSDPTWMTAFCQLQGLPSAW